jgi:ribose transport system substrate-binding protein
MLLSLVLLVGVLAACGGGTSTSGDSGDSATTESYTIAYSCIADAIAPFPTVMRTELQKQCEEKGWTFNYLAAEGDFELQAEQVTQLLAQNPDVLLVWAGDASLAPMYISEANEKGIPVILMMCSIDEEYRDQVYGYVGSDMYGVSYEQGQRMVEKYGADSGKLVVSVSGVEAQQDYQDKLRGFKDAIADTNWTFIDPTYCQSSRDTAQSAMETYLATYGDSIDIVIGFDDDLTMGCINAIDEAGLTGTIDVYSQMGMKEMVQAIRDGKATETLALPASYNINAVIDAIETCMSGEEHDWFFPADYLFVTSENANDYEGDF